MFPLQALIVYVLQSLDCLFTAPTPGHLHVFLAGTLPPQKLSVEQRFVRDHRVLNRAQWSSRQGARILQGLLLGMLPATVPIVNEVD